MFSGSSSSMKPLRRPPSDHRRPPKSSEPVRLVRALPLPFAFVPLEPPGAPAAVEPAAVVTESTAVAEARTEVAVPVALAAWAIPEMAAEAPVAWWSSAALKQRRNAVAALAPCRAIEGRCPASAERRISDLDEGKSRHSSGAGPAETRS